MVRPGGGRLCSECRLADNVRTLTTRADYRRCVSALLGLGLRAADPAAVRAAAWVARCVGRGASAPLRPGDLDALSRYLQQRRLKAGTVLFHPGVAPSGVWIVREGAVELTVGAGPRRVVVALLHPGDVEGDIHLLLAMPAPYAARAVDDVVALYLDAGDFDALLAAHPAITRRWMTSIAGRTAHTQMRIVDLLGAPLPVQAARLLLAEADDQDLIGLPQRVLAAMLGVQRSSLNKVLRELEDQGLLDLGYRTIRIRDRGKLARLAAPAGRAAVGRS
jgi:CRP-like cAMP-binding protein